MPVSHKFTSPKLPSADPTIVGSTEWNDTHSVTISDSDVDAGAGIVESKLALNFATHPAVTLDVNADTLLSLSTQALGLDTQTANRIFAGPTTGGAAVPAFRSLVAADIPALSYVDGTGVAGQVAEWVDSNTIQAAKLIGPAINILTLTNAAASTLALNITAAKTLTLTAADNYTLTIPATGTAALLATANVFTAQNQITVATATSDALILKTSDDNTTKNIIEAQSSTAAKLFQVTADGRLYLAAAAPTLPSYFYLSKATGATLASGTNYLSEFQANFVANAATSSLWALQFSVKGTGTNNFTDLATFNGSIENGLTSGTIGAQNGMSLNNIISSGGNTTSVYGYRALTQLTGAGGATLNVGFNARTPTKDSTGVIVTSQGVLIDNQGFAGMTTAYGLYIEAQSAAATNYAIFTNAGLNELNDQLFVDGSADRVQLIVQNNGTQTTNPFELQNSSGTALISLSGAGNYKTISGGGATSFYAMIGGTGNSGGIGWRGYSIGANYSLSATNVPTVDGTNAGYVKGYAIGMSVEDSTDKGMTFWSGSGAGVAMTQKMSITNAGLITIGATNGTGKFNVVGETDVVQLKVTGSTTQNAVVGRLIRNDGNTNAVANVLDIQGQSTGTVAANFGSALLFSLETATNGTFQNAGRVYAVTTEATNATRKYDLVGTAFDTAEREGIRIRADGTRSLVGIDTAAPTARLHLPAGGTAANTAPLKFTTQASALTVVEQGTMELVGNSLQFSQLAKRRGVVMSQSTMTASFTLVSSAAESAAIITAEHGANYLEVGKMEEIRLYGTLQKDVGAPTNTLTIRVKYAGATIHTIVSSNAAVAANTQVEIIITATLRTTGATGTMQINSIVRIDGDVITPAAPTLVTVNTTSAENTTITAQFTNSSGTNNLVIHQGRVLCIEPNR